MNNNFNISVNRKAFIGLSIKCISQSLCNEIYNILEDYDVTNKDQKRMLMKMQRNAEKWQKEAINLFGGNEEKLII